MTKAEVVSKVAQEAGITKKAAATALNALVAAVHDTLKQKNGKIRNLGLGNISRYQEEGADRRESPNTQEDKDSRGNGASFQCIEALKEAVKKAK